MSFQPYGRGDVRIVSDLSRFEFESPTPRSRSRNPTPPSLNEKPSVIDLGHDYHPQSPINQTTVPPEFFDDDVPVPDPGPQRRKTLLEIAEDSQALPKVREPGYIDIYKYYENPSTSSLTQSDNKRNDFVPYPSSVKDQPFDNSAFDTQASLNIPTISDDLGTLKTPITNQTSIMPSTTLTNFTNANYKDKDLPPIIQPSQYYKDQNSSVYKSNDVSSMSSRKQRMENHLVKSVMNRPLFSMPASGVFRGDEFFEGRDIVITANFVVYLFEMIIAIIIVTLSSILVNNDHRLTYNIYRYFIAESAISLIVSLLFMTTIVNFEKRNGSFYVTIAMVLSMVSFILAVSTVIPNKDCATKSICNLRKANSGFIIISAFLWLCDLVMFLTVLYVSRMNLLDDLNFDYSNQGLQKEYNRSGESSTIGYNEHAKGDLIDPTDGQPLRQYWLNESGEMFELTDEFDVRGKNKIIVYTI